LLAGALFTNPWPTLAIITIVYAASIPMAINSYARVKARAGRTIDDRTSSADDGIQPPP
jgi:CDP-diacylglycerol--serine O-phosphatidyltransferase